VAGARGAGVQGARTFTLDGDEVRTSSADMRRAMGGAADRDQQSQAAYEAGVEEERARASGATSGAARPAARRGGGGVEEERARASGATSGAARPAARRGGGGATSGAARPAARRGGGGLVDDGAGFILGLVAYALLVNYLRGGVPAVRGWLAAKFINRPYMGASAGSPAQAAPPPAQADFGYPNPNDLTRFGRPA
jgi:hypothetical protein